MKRLLPLLLLIFLSGCSIGKKKMAALNVSSNPKAGIFLDGDHIGSTPFYDDKLKEGEYSIRIVPENSSGLPWESRIKLSSGILTVISRELAQTFDTSSGHVLSLEPELEKNKTSIVIVTTPEGSIINIDGEPKGTAPLSINDISPGDHVLSVSFPGYIEKSIKARLEEGYKLTASIQLSKSSQIMELEKNTEIEKTTENQENSNTENNEEEKVLDKDLETQENSTTDKTSDNEEDTNSKRKTVGLDLKPPYVTIKETDTGWLNVREKSSTASDIVTKVYPGDQFKYLDTSKTGWYQIEIDNKTEGWISSKYATLTEN